MDILSKYSKGKIIHASQYHSVCGHSSSLRACAEQQQSSFSVCSQRVKHVVLRSSREYTTEQIIMIQNSIAFWSRATSPPSVYCPRTLVCLCAGCVSARLFYTSILHMGCYSQCPMFPYNIVISAFLWKKIIHFMTYDTRKNVFVWVSTSLDSDVIHNPIIHSLNNIYKILIN